MDNFEIFYELQIKKIKNEIKKSSERRKGPAEAIANSFENNKKYKAIVSEAGKQRQREYYNKNKDAIDKLIAEGIPVTEASVRHRQTELDMEKFYNENFQKIVKKVRGKAEDLINSAFSNTRLTLFNITGVSTEGLSPDNADRFVEKYEEVGFSQLYIKELPLCVDYLNKRLLNGITDLYLESTGADRRQFEWVFRAIAKQKLKDSQRVWRLLDEIKNDFTVTRLMEMLAANRFFADNYNEVRTNAEAFLRLQSDILDTIPDSYALLYPEARKMKRHFVLCIGPTNSGKTYRAVEDLKNADTGIYLAPLRLLAYEQFENLNFTRPCNLVTGEECIYIPCAQLQSSTIEMLDTGKHYDVAVIDEAQMVGDEFRGGAWTRAILGACADRIYLCAAPHAEHILIKLIEECGDTYEVHYTERRTALEFDDTFETFPYDVETGDALIVFTRRDVHAVAAELQHDGLRCSIIYGALPYDVRHEEARKFNSGETDVVVATDAIGMGLNMPIRRIVFIEDQKFDGREKRPLRSDEIQQIAGRAGRYGMFDTGYYSSLYSSDMIRDGIKDRVSDITNAIIEFPPSLLDLNVSLSKILEKWNSIEDKDGYTKANIKTEIKLCKVLERLTSDKYLIYELISIPIDERDPAVYALWEELSENVIRHAVVHLEDVEPAYSEKSQLSELETAYKICDLLFHFSTKFWKDGSEKEIIRIKTDISSITMRILGEQALTGKTCRSCGRRLSWDHRFDICDRCYNRRSAGRTGFRPAHRRRKEHRA
ncbi:MAG: hypothetical protein II695_07170 [Oscillospiraceae bacterium]|nr:hypothetical protein [Oscillospiraceae bacterium]